MSIVTGKYVCKNRKTKCLIERSEVVIGIYKKPIYIVRCINHGGQIHAGTKTIANYQMSHPWNWCSQCADDVNEIDAIAIYGATK